MKIRAILMTALLLQSVAPSGYAQGRADYHPHLRPVKVVAPTLFPVTLSGGGAAARAPALAPAPELALYASGDLQRGDARVTRAIIVIHGKLRNADAYFATMQRAREAAGAAQNSTLIIAPQFLATVDSDALPIPKQVLRWVDNGWMSGDPAAAPAPVSSYAALDALLLRLADRARFPALREVVLAGHSGGAQVVQRYAIAGRAPGTLRRAGIRVRFLIANPSSYAYFDAMRPLGDAADPLHPSALGAFDAARCPDFDDWKYGMGKLPPYLARQPDNAPAQLLSRYLSRNVTVLIGGNDNDPQQRALDKSCAAEAQGPQRMARALSYVAYLRARAAAAQLQDKQYFGVVPGVGHNEKRMLESPCARAILFGTGQCTSGDDNG